MKFIVRLSYALVCVHMSVYAASHPVILLHPFENIIGAIAFGGMAICVLIGGVE